MACFFMAKEKIELDDLVELTKKMFHEYYSGNLELWFSYLCNESIWMGHTEPLLFGGDAIRNHFQKFQGVQSTVLKEEYFPLQLGSDAAAVYGQFILGNSDHCYQATAFFS